MSEQDCIKNLRLLYLYTILNNFVVILPVCIPYYRDVLGLSFHDFLIGETVFAGVMVALDVPTGWLADVWGRKKTLIASAAFAVLGYTALLLATGFWSAVLSQGIIGIAVALSSGANTAMLYDTLLTQGRESEYRQKEGLRFGIQLYSVATASILGGYLYTLGHKLPLLVDIACLVLAIGVTLQLTEPKCHRARSEKHPLADIRDTMIYALHGHRQVAGVILLMMLLFSSTKICMWSIQAYMAALHIPEANNGWVIAIVMVIGGISGHLGHKLFPALKGEQALKALIFGLAAFLVIAGLGPTYLGLGLLCLEGFFFGYGMPRAQEAINRLVDSDRRATILSTANVMASLAFIPLSQVIGLTTDHGSIADGLLIHAAIMVVIGGGTIYYSSRRAYKDKVTATGT